MVYNIKVRIKFLMYYFLNFPFPGRLFLLFAATSSKERGGREQGMDSTILVRNAG